MTAKQACGCIDADRTYADLTRHAEALDRDLRLARARADSLQLQLDQQVSHERELIMRSAVERHAAGKSRERWVVATHRSLSDDPNNVLGVLHVKDPTAPPRIVKPTTRHGRYQNGDTREAGPGSHIGLALCKLPLMADELWVVADHVLKSAARQQKNGGSGRYVALCGMCSYLSGQPTIEAAMEALR